VVVLSYLLCVCVGGGGGWITEHCKALLSLLQLHREIVCCGGKTDQTRCCVWREIRPIKIHTPQPLLRAHKELTVSRCGYI
jgi:hypothetical protein